MATKNWLESYSTAAPVKKFQEGGQMSAAPAPTPAPAEGAPAPEATPQGGGDIEQMIAEYAQTRDPQLAVAICDLIVELMAQGQGGAPAEGGAPMAKKGMKMKKGPKFKGSCKAA